MKYPIYIFVALLALALRSPARLNGQAVGVKTYETSTVPRAVVVKTFGKCEFSEDGQTFTTLKPYQILKQGAFVRTGEGARADLFFRRIGTTVRLQPETEIQLETMNRSMKDGEAVMQTLINLRTGRIFTAVRSMIAGSSFEIRNAAGRSVVEGGGGKGRYIITADGTHVAEKNSVVPLKLVGETGVTIITPGQKFSSREGKMLPLEASEAVKNLIEFDELDAISEQPDTTESTPSAR